MNKGLRDIPRSRVATDEYRDGWDKIFRNKKDNLRDDGNAKKDASQRQNEESNEEE